MSSPHQRAQRFFAAIGMTVFMSGLGLAAVTGLDRLAGAVLPTAKQAERANDELRERFLAMREPLPQRDVTYTATRRFDQLKDGGRPVSYHMAVDADGFIEPSRIHDKPDLTIVFLGGSTTECMFVQERERFPYLVGRILEERTHKAVNTLNGGYSGNNTMHANVLMLGKVAPLRPQYVVLMEAINDVSVMFHGGGYWNDIPTRKMMFAKTDFWADFQNGQGPAAVRLGRLLKDLVAPHLYEHLKPVLQPLFTRAHEALLSRGGGAGGGNADEFAGRRNRRKTLDHVAALRDYRASIETFIATTRAWGSEPVLMTQPNMFDEPLDPMVLSIYEPFVREGAVLSEYFLVYRQMNAMLREIAAQHHVQLIDLERVMPKETAFLYDGLHMTEKASHLAAETIAAQILPRLPH